MRIEMRVLLLAVTGEEPSFRAWQFALRRERVPFEAIVLGSDPPRPSGSRLGRRLTAGRGHARFQALILATGAVLDHGLTRAERDELDDLARNHGLRRLIAYAYPSAAYGLQAPRQAGLLEGVAAELTPAGMDVFPYLRGQVPVQAGTWGYLASPLTEERFEVLLTGPEGSALLGIRCHGDGREEMVQTYDSNPDQPQTQLLRHGQLAWVTRGIYMGCQRSFLSLQIDDVLLANHSWNASTHRTDRHAAALMRMSAADAMHAARWSRARGLRLDLACNGGGSERYRGARGARVDPLLGALQTERDAFGWINHTYEHINLDEASRGEIEMEIGRNLNWARGHGLVLQPGALVTGEHSGLANLAVTPARGENPDLAAALQAGDVRYLACDASRPYPVQGGDPGGPRWPPGAPFTVGPALAVPRYPTALPYDAATATQALDRHRHSSSGMRAASWRQLLLAEATRMFALAMGNDPRPHYFHQSNMISELEQGGILYGLIDTLLNLYRSLFADNTPLLQPTLGETGELLRRASAWWAAATSDLVEGYIDQAGVTVISRLPGSLEVPLTGTEIGTEYGGTRSGWTRVDPGETRIGLR